MKEKDKKVKYPGTREAMDGNTAVIMCERESTDAAGAYPITPSTQMGEYWAEEVARGHLNISGKPLLFVEPEGEHAAAAVTAGFSMTGLRATNFSSGQGIAYMHESLYAAVGKRLPYILNVGCRAITKATLNVHAGHDDYHCVDDTGFFQVFGKNTQHTCDLNIIAHKIAELSLTPGIVAQDGFLTTHLIESLHLPERALIEEYLGLPEDIIVTPTPAQKIIYGEKRRRIPELWTVDNPVMFGLVQNQDAYMQSIAAQRPFFFDHIAEITEQCMREFYELTGRRYERVLTYLAEDAEYLIVGQGSLIPSAEVVADYLRETRGLKVGVVDMVMFRPFPGDMIGKILKGKKGVTVLERLDQPLAADLPLVREIRATVSKCMENGQSKGGKLPYPDYETYSSMSEIPVIYSGSFGMGSRDLQPEGLIGAVENMLPKGSHKKFFYLSIDFVRENAYTPKQEIYQDTITDAYPNVKDLAVRGSENPDLMPKDSIVVRFHSVGGWGAMTTGKNLAMTLFDLLGYNIKANPKYGSEKKGQPTTYYLAAAPELIRINCEYYHVDVVLSPDPNVFKHTNALAGLKKGGYFIIQSDLESPEKVWATISPRFQKIIIDNEIRVFYIDAFKIAREEATDTELQFRMQGIAFQGSFFAASPVMKNANLTEEKLFKAIEDQLQSKFGAKGARVVEDNLRVVRRGFTELHEIKDKKLTDTAGASDVIPPEPPLPVMVKMLPESTTPLTDIHRFWEQTGNFYMRGMGNDNITDPFIGMSLLPASTGLYRDMTGIRFEYPEWVPENCTGCGNCWTICPDTAIPGLVNDITQIGETVVRVLQKKGKDLKHLKKSVRVMEKTFRELIANSPEKEKSDVRKLMNEAISRTVSAHAESEREELKREYDLFIEEVKDFQFALTRPFYTVPEKKMKNAGGLLSVTVNPQTCKGCMECVAVCNDDALRPAKQTAEAVDMLKKNWNFWLDLPNTPQKYIRVDNIEEGIGALETILLDKDCGSAVVSGDGACLGCSEKTVVRLFVATVEALMRPRVAKYLEKLNGLIENLEKHIKMKLVKDFEVGDTEAMQRALNDLKDEDLTLASLSSKFEKLKESPPLDQEWLKRVTGIIAKLKDLRWKYTQGETGRGRSSMGMTNATGCTSVWGSTYPINPYPFPWVSHLFQDSPSLALGIFEGHMSKMAEGFKAVRIAELELAGKYEPSEHKEFFTYFNWEKFSDEEFLLCPPVVSVGGDGAMYDIGFQNLSRALMTGKPIKVLVVDTQVYSNTGGQACTSGFPGQISDMAQFGKAVQGKSEIRKEIGLIGMAHRTSYILQSGTALPSHMIEGFIQGLKTRRPALFNLYTSCQPEHGIPDDAGMQQGKLALESRTYPYFRYNPDLGVTPAECFDLVGNPMQDKIWPEYTLKYLEDGQEKSMKLPSTFADFALTEGRFRKQFRKAPQDTWNDKMVPVADFLQLSPKDREGKFPYIWAVDNKKRLSRVLVSQAIIAGCEDRENFWRMLRALAGSGEGGASGSEELISQIRSDVVQKISAGLMELATGNSGGLSSLMSGAGSNPGSNPGTASATGGSSAAMSGEYVKPWIETDDCTGCDECVNINPKIFAYNGDRKAVIKSEDGPYSDIVLAAEKCTASVIHPGLPANRSGKDIDKWIKRGEKFN